MLSIGEAAKRSGVKAETIRFYEKTGIVPQPKRSFNGQRVYADEDVERLSFIRRCRDHGFSLPQAKEILALASKDIVPGNAVRKIAEDNLADINKKILELQNLSGILSYLITECASSGNDRALVDSLRGK